MKAILQDGRDVTDTVFELRTGEGMWNDPEFLQSLRDLADCVALAEIGTDSLSLKLIVPPGI